MKMHDLGPAYGSKTTTKRVGRGIGSGLGKLQVQVTRDKSKKWWQH